jgi:hypothetical protein
MAFVGASIDPRKDEDGRWPHVRRTIRWRTIRLGAEPADAGARELRMESGGPFPRVATVGHKDRCPPRGREMHVASVFPNLDPVHPGEVRSAERRPHGVGACHAQGVVKDPGRGECETLDAKDEAEPLPIAAEDRKPAARFARPPGRVVEGHASKLEGRIPSPLAEEPFHEPGDTPDAARFGSEGFGGQKARNLSRSLGGHLQPTQNLLLGMTAIRRRPDDRQERGGPDPQSESFIPDAFVRVVSWWAV